MPFSKMNPELKAKWIAALRSGDYKQSKGGLCNHAGHCCLGVLCEVAGLKKEPANYRDHDDSYRYTDSDGSSSTSTLPEHFKKESGLNYITQNELIKRNDGDPTYPAQTFSEIADFIETSL